MSLVCCAAVACYAVALGGGLTESFALLPLTVVLWLVASGRRTWPIFAGSGLALSLACLFSLQSLPAALVLGLATVWSGPSALLTAKKVGLGVAGAIVLPLVVGAWVVARGAGGDALDQLVTYNAAYRQIDGGLTHYIAEIALIAGFIVLPVGLAFIRMIRDPRPFAVLDWACAAWCLSYTAYLFMQGRFWLHYLILMVPAAAVLASTGCGQLFLWWHSHDRRLRVRSGALTATIGLALIVAVVATNAFGAMDLKQVSRQNTLDAQAAGWVRANTAGSSSLFVWGDAPYVYLATGRAPYDRYVDLFPLVTDGYWSASKTDDLLAAWRVSPPEIIVEAGSGGQLCLAAPGQEAGSIPDDLMPLCAFVRGNYHLVATLGDQDGFDDVYGYGI